MFSQELDVGVKCRWKRGCRLSQDCDARMLVRAVIVHDQMKVETGRSLGVDLFEKADELLMPMARHAVADDLAVEHAEGGKQRRRAVAFVVVSLVPQRPFFMGSPGCVRSSA